MKLIGAIHKATSKQNMDKLKAAGLTGARIQLAKMTASEANSLIAIANASDLEVHLDTRGNKPTITSIQLSKSSIPVDKVMINQDDRLLFYIQIPHTTARPNYKANLALSYIPPILSDSVGLKLCIDDGNIIIQIDQVYLEKNHIIAFDATVAFVDLEKVDAIYHEGVSSFEISLHSHAAELLTPYDVACLQAIDSQNKSRVSYITASFAETEQQIIRTDSAVKSLGYSKAQITPKIETLIGVKNSRMIANALKHLYPNDHELWIARGDLAVALHGQRAGAMKDAEKVIFEGLKNSGTSVIVATDVANSLRNYLNLKVTATLTTIEKADILEELKQGCSGFVLAGEMYAGPNHQGEYAEQIIRAVKQVLVLADWRD